MPNCPTGKSHIKPYKPPIKLELPKFPHYEKVDQNLFLEGVVTNPAKYGPPTITPSIYSKPEPLKDDIYENINNQSGNQITTENGLTVSKTQSIQTFGSFLMDGEQGKGSIFATKDNITGDEFVKFFGEDEQLTLEEWQKKGADRETFLKERNEQLKSQGKKPAYGTELYQYSAEKAKASFEAMDASKDGIVDAKEFDNFYNNAKSEDATVNIGERQYQIKDENLSVVKLNKLPEEIQKATKSETPGKLIKEGTTTPGKLITPESKKRAGKAKLDLYEYEYKTTNNGTKFKNGELNEENAELLKTYSNYATENKTDKMPIEELLKGMEDKGIPRDKVLTLLKEKGINTDAQGLEISINNHEYLMKSLKTNEKKYTAE